MSRLIVNLPAGSIGGYSICTKDGYTHLYKQGISSIMSDNEKEYEDHEEFFEEVSGDVLIGGLGIGMVNEFLRHKDNVSSVTIIEKYQEVIDLVWDSCYKDDRFRLIKADIETWSPDKHFNIGWFDTWLTDHPSMSLEEYDIFIRSKYGPYCSWIGIWKRKGHSHDSRILTCS